MSKFSSTNSWVILSLIEQQIKDKIERFGVPLKDWDISIYRGVLTGYNEAFIIDGKRKDELIAQDPKSAEIIRPILRGRDIKRYIYDFADTWLINAHNGIKERGVKPINIDDYPAVKKHLNQFLPGLEERLDKGLTPYNLRNCTYMDDFNRQKIVWKRVGSLIRFAYDESSHLTLDSTCFATGNSIKYLTAILNSKMGNYLFFKDSPKTGTGDLIISVQAVEPIMVPTPSVAEQSFIERQIDALLSTTIPSLEVENEINSVVYKLYHLSSDEIKFIEIQ